MMKKNRMFVKIMLPFLLLFSNLSARDWYYDTSTRIEALGVDFAGVLADRQTDIDIRNPVYLIDYRAVTVVHRGYYYNNQSMPVNISMFYNKFGIALKYGGHYFLNTNATYPKDRLYRFNLSGYYAKSNLGLQYDFYYEDQKLDYVTTVTQKLSHNFTFHALTVGYHPLVLNGLDMRCRLALGTYDSTESEFIGGQLEPIGQINFLIPSAQIGLSYDRPVLEKGSLCLLVDLGGPTSAFETKRLPLPFQSTVKRNEPGSSEELNLFANSFSTRVAGAISYSPSQSLLVATGVNEFWSGAKTKQANSITFWYNNFVIPIAIEYYPNSNISIRAGVSANYWYQDYKQKFSYDRQIFSYWGTAQSLGLGFRLFENWFLDLSSLSNLLQIESVNLALRKEF